MHKAILLGVNIDHIATLRQARGTRYPEPLQAALLAEEAGADELIINTRFHSKKSADNIFSTKIDKY